MESLFPAKQVNSLKGYDPNFHDFGKQFDPTTHIQTNLKNNNADNEDMLKYMPIKSLNQEEFFQKHDFWDF